MAPKKTPKALLDRAKERQRLCRLQSKLHRERNKEEYNAKARERMARKRAEMQGEDRVRFLERQREHSKKYYERFAIQWTRAILEFNTASSNRNAILDKADAKRYTEYESCYGRESFNRNYKFRDVRPRELLDMEKGSVAYNAALGTWRTQKVERLQLLKKGEL
ncbi:hypothetical protein V5O48_009071 [Marasmius crinis-equi]|uniref:Uncharacterized protein n=1 Tax=Marasmius crinis-equi TaxID=585013 RepID=A0ABR3FC56_9AGAR